MVKLLEENIEEKLLDISLGYGLLLLKFTLYSFLL